jgi:hypothetical protein
MTSINRRRLTGIWNAPPKSKSSSKGRSRGSSKDECSAAWPGTAPRARTHAPARRRTHTPTLADGGLIDRLDAVFGRRVRRQQPRPKPGGKRTEEPGEPPVAPLPLKRGLLRTMLFGPHAPRWASGRDAQTLAGHSQTGSERLHATTGTLLGALRGLPRGSRPPRAGCIRRGTRPGGRDEWLRGYGVRGPSAPRVMISTLTRRSEPEATIPSSVWTNRNSSPDGSTNWS